LKLGECQAYIMQVIYFLAFRIAAGGTVVAALGEDEHVGALRALAGHVLGQAVVLKLGLVIVVNVFFKYAGDGVGAG
jgi:hypothetical protein